MFSPPDIDEEAAMAPGLPPQPPLLARKPEPEACDSLWLPPCPVCSWIDLRRRPAQDRLECPAFYLARHTSEKRGANYYMMRGCDHATNIGLGIGPTRNRLKLATAWRRAVATLTETHFARYEPELRASFIGRLGYRMAKA